MKLSQISASRRLAVLLSGIWLFVAGLASLEIIDEGDLIPVLDGTAGFLVAWLLIGVMPLALVWATAWVIAGFRLEQHHQHEASELGSVGAKAQLENTKDHKKGLHPTWLLVCGAIAVAIVAVGLITSTSPSEYEEGFGEAIGLFVV